MSYVVARGAMIFTVAIALLTLDTGQLSTANALAVNSRLLKSNAELEHIDIGADEEAAEKEGEEELHNSGVDSGDILAYSGEISGDLAEQQPSHPGGK